MQEPCGHKFHIPVLGVGFSVDAPLKVAKYGISSVMSLVDDTLLEKLRKFHLKSRDKTYIPIETNEVDSRAKRITAYLNMVNQFVKEDFEKLKNSTFEPGSEITKYFEMLPDDSDLKIQYSQMLETSDITLKLKIEKNIREQITPGSIDVNIMTKLDKTNYDTDGAALPSEFNDALAALRGYASSDLESSIVFSAGMNPRLYSYIESFTDFYPDINSNFKKKIVIKISDFRSALIQGKFLAKKGLWVSEYRIESGLNCGGHAFATDGLLMGPILEELKNRKDELINTLKEIYLPALSKKEIAVNETKLTYNLTVQGGVGISSEQEFLIRYYGAKSVGWGSPFLLVPEVMNVDDYTLQRLCEAREEDLYLSEVSPLGVPFNNLRNNSKDIEKIERVELGKPGSPCPKKFLVSNKEFSDKPICTASITYLNKKIAQLKENITDPNQFSKEFDRVTDKVCLCEGLTVTPLILNNISTPKLSRAVSVCPGPNIAYYSKVATLKEMVDHIYGRINLVTDENRPNMFVKELKLYIDYFENKVEKSAKDFSAQTETYLNTFRDNLIDGINYYKQMAGIIMSESDLSKEKMLYGIYELEQRLISFAVPVNQPA
ncbi:MAG: hypothetical protein RDU14_06265 [Melioribacteraceae bacterium]|nr:hypothetical protein [Melioribacteraceae bacterium]